MAGVAQAYQHLLTIDCLFFSGVPVWADLKPPRFWIPGPNPVADLDPQQNWVKTSTLTFS